jgi:hypothetical protein
MGSDYSTKFSAKFAAFVPPRPADSKRVAPFPKSKKQTDKKETKDPSSTSLMDLMKQRNDALMAAQSSQARLEVAAEATAHQIKEVSTVSAQVSDLITNLSDVIMIEQNNGISRCEIELTGLRQDSLFKGAALTFDHYDTAPHSFNIYMDVVGQEAATLFNAHVAPITAHLEELFPSFKFNLHQAGFTNLAKKEKEKRPLFAKTVNKASHSDNS